jgi:DNA-binding NarL/FixJ family response regulator
LQWPGVTLTIGSTRKSKESKMQTLGVIRIRVAHEDPIVAAGLAAVLREQCDFAVTVGPLPSEVVDAASALEFRHPDVVVSDYCSALAHLAAARSAGAALFASFSGKVMVVTQHDREWDVRTAVHAGVRGYLLQSCGLDELVKGVRALRRGSRYLCDPVAGLIADSVTHEQLTTRETEVLDLIVRGMCNKTIASDLGIALGTVKAHVKIILAKLDASTRTHAAAVATRRGLVGSGSRSSVLVT